MSNVEGKEHDQKGKGRALHCVVVTPEKTLLDAIVDFVAIPLDDGELGVLPGRTPLLGRLGIGELRTRTGTTVVRYLVDGGFAQIRDDVVTILTTNAVASTKIDAGAAAKELEAAVARKGVTEVEVAEKDRAVRRARQKIRVAAKG